MNDYEVTKTNETSLLLNWDLWDCVLCERLFKGNTVPENWKKKINAVKLINFKSALAINSHGSAFKVVRAKYCYLVNKTVEIIKYKVEFILARNNYFYCHLLLSSIVSTTEELITILYTFFVPVISFLKIFHDSESSENISLSANTLYGYISLLFCLSLWIIVLLTLYNNSNC